MNNQPGTQASEASGEPDFGARQRWAQRRDIVIATIGILAIAAAVVWVGAMMIRALLILLLAGFIAYALTPAVKFLSRFFPRPLAIFVVYLTFILAIGAVGYVLVNTTIGQVGAFSQQVTVWLTPGPNGQPSPAVQRLSQFGITQNQLQSAGDQVIAQVKNLANGALPFVESVFGIVLDTILTIVLSIYLLVDGTRLIGWLRTSAPLRLRTRVTFAVATVDRVVGGYIRGQIILATLVGVLVGVGMTVFQVPYAILLGVIAFILEFIPVIGVFISGALCVLLALTQGWLIAVLVLGYFVVMHVIEGDVVGPRIVGRAVGVHPAVSIFALIAGGELFGIWGALFASPLAGLIQAIVAETWREWRASHTEMFVKSIAVAPVPVTTAEAADIVRKAHMPFPPDEEEEEVEQVQEKTGASSASGISPDKD